MREWPHEQMSANQVPQQLVAHKTPSYNAQVETTIFTAKKVFLFLF